MSGSASSSPGLLAAKRLKELGKPADWAYEMVFAALIGGIVGARLWSIVENWDEAKDDLLGSLFSGTGLVCYGGAARRRARACSAGRSGAACSTLDAARPRRARRSRAGYAIGRIGCQLAGDGDYGKPWDGPWAMAYPDGTVPTTETVHPTPIYETLAMGGVAWCLWRLRDRVRPGGLFALYLVLAGAERFLVEFLRRNDASSAGLTAAAARRARDDARRRRAGCCTCAAAACPRRRAPESAARPGASCFRTDHGRDQPVRATPRPPPSQDGRLLDRRLRRGRARARVRHAGLRRRRGRPARPGARVPRRAAPPTTTAPARCSSPPRRVPCTAVLRVFAEEGLGCDVASGGELHLALQGRLRARADLPARQREVGEAELAAALAAGVGTDRRRQRRRRRAARAACCRRGAPPARAAARPPGRRRRHARGDLTGQADSKFGLDPREARALARRPARRTSTSAGLHFHLGSQLVDPTPYRAAVAALAGLGELRRLRPRRRLRRRLHGRRPAAGDRRGGRGRGRGRARAARPRHARSCSSRAARWSPTPA